MLAKPKSKSMDGSPKQQALCVKDLNGHIGRTRTASGWVLFHGVGAMSSAARPTTGYTDGRRTRRFPGEVQGAGMVHLVVSLGADESKDASAWRVP